MHITNKIGWLHTHTVYTRGLKAYKRVLWVVATIFSSIYQLSKFGITHTCVLCIVDDLYAAV